MRSVLFTVEIAILASLLSEEVLVEDHVLVLNRVNFVGVVYTTEFILVAFYCKAIEPLTAEFSKAAKKLSEEKSPIRLAKMDLPAQSLSLADYYGVRKYPGLRFFKNGRPFVYTGELHAEDIVSWVKRKSGPPAPLEVSTEDQIKELIATEPRTILGFFPDLETDKAKAFLEDASRSDATSYALIRDVALIKALNGTPGETMDCFKIANMNTAMMRDMFFDDYNHIVNDGGTMVSKFKFFLPELLNRSVAESDGSIAIGRTQNKVIKIEHSLTSTYALLGLEVWPCAFLLSDLMVHLGLQGQLSGRSVLELGAGTGFTSIVASMFARKVVSTDVDRKGLLEIKERNTLHNADLVKAEFVVMPLDLQGEWGEGVTGEVRGADLVIASDLIYETDLSRSLASTLAKMLVMKPSITVYVGTVQHYVGEDWQPLYGFFFMTLDELMAGDERCTLAVEEMSLENIPKYFFTYERISEMTLSRIYCE